MIMLTAFSRNYLGVHTPQDVLTAILLGAAVVLAMSKLFAYLSAHKEKENMFLAVGIVFGILALIYFRKAIPERYCKRRTAR
jgi:membrane-associated phospholipid phosphatase